MNTREKNQYKKAYAVGNGIQCPVCNDTKDVIQDGEDQYWRDDVKYVVQYMCTYCDLTFDLIYRLDDIDYNPSIKSTGKGTPFKVSTIKVPGLKL